MSIFSDIALDDRPGMDVVPDASPAAACRGGEEGIEGSVIVPLFNHARFVDRAIEGIAAAWRPGFEVIVVDDASDDDGFAVARSALARHPRIPALAVRLPANGGGIGNAAPLLALARGRYLVQADSDDVMMPDRLERVAACFRGDPACRLVTSNALHVSDGDEVLGLNDVDGIDAVFDDPAAAAAKEFDWRWLGATAAYHRDVLLSFPPIDPTLCPYGFDMLSPLRALLLGRHHYVARPLVRWRQHPGNAHRVAGAYGDDADAERRYAAKLLMVHRQKLRDVAASANAPDAAAVAAIAERSFAEAFDRWCRLQTWRCGDPRPLGSHPLGAHRTMALPPVASLAAGESLRFARGDRGGAIAERWSGFHAAESWGCWTARLAVLSLRIVAPGAAMLKIVLMAPAGARRVSLSLVAGRSVDLSIAAYGSREVVLPLPPCDGQRDASLLIHVPDAAKSSDDDPALPDTRLIGIGLASIEVAIA